MQYHLEWYLEAHLDLIQHLLESTYVDDLVMGANTEDEAFDLYTQEKQISGLTQGNS